MKRLSLTLAALFCGLALSPSAFAQTAPAKKTTPKQDAKPAVATAPAPISEELLKARMRPPVRGTASVEFITGPVKLVGTEVQSIIKVRNTDSAPIIGLKIDEYFYAGQKEISACTARVRNPIAAGEIVDVPMSCPNPKERATGSNLMFTHANGKVQPKPVKKFTDATKK
jgi:hypothetical protein